MTHSYDINHKIIRVGDKVYAENAALAGIKGEIKGFSQSLDGNIYALVEFVVNGRIVKGDMPTNKLHRLAVQS